MATIRRQLRTEDRSNVQIWTANPEDLILIQGAWGPRRGVVMGVVDEIAPDGQDIFLYKPAFRFHITNAMSKPMPVMVYLGDYDCHRRAIAIDHVTVGPRRIARQLREINPLYEQYAQVIETLRRPYLKDPQQVPAHWKRRAMR